MIAEGLRERLGQYGLRARPGRAAPRRARGRTSRLGRRVSPRAIVVGALVLALLLGGWLWLRDSSLVAVKRVRVLGVTGPDAAAIRAALVRAASNMTTLHVRMDQLNMAVAPYPVVKHLDVSTQFPHGIQIRVIEQAPVAAVTFAGHSLAVAADGTVLHDVRVSPSLPVIPLRVPPGGSRVTGQAAAEVAVLAAAPEAFAYRVTEVTSTSAHGLVAQLRHGPSIYFGDSTRLSAKWAAAIAVLADSGSAGALYIDVTDPGRPAAGGGSTGSSATGSATAGASATGAAAGGTTQTTSTPASATPTAGSGASSTSSAAVATTTTTPATTGTPGG